MSTLVIGNWEEVYQGHCLEFEHRRNKNSSLKHPSSILQDLEAFTNLLQEIQPVSVQITSEHEQTLENFFNLLTTVGNNCPGLECFGISFNLPESEQEEDKECVDIDLDLMSVEKFSLKQIACVSAWRVFITCVKSSFQHLSVCGDLNVPYFAVKSLLTDCRHFTILDGGYSVKNCISSLDPESFSNFENLSGKERHFITSLQLLGSNIPFNFSSLRTGFRNVRNAMIDWRMGMDLTVFASKELANLCDLFLRNPRIEGEEEMPVGPDNLIPTVELIFPEKSRLIELTLGGIDLSRKSWEKLGERAKFLKLILTSRCGRFEAGNLEPLQKLPRLEVLNVDAENYLKGRDLTPLFFSSSGRKRFCLRVLISRNNLESDAEILETVLGILESLNNERANGDEKMEGRTGVDIEYWHHKGGFDFLRKGVEAKGYQFERDPDPESRIWNCRRDVGFVGERYMRLIEEKKAPVCER